MANDTTVVVELPMTLRVSVAFPDGAPRNPQADAAALADWAARKLSHISHDQINACNELNRLFPHGTGMVASVDAQLQGDVVATPR
jgi:hypothetical protein